MTSLESSDGLIEVGGGYVEVHRGSADTALRNLHQHLVALSGQADLKANIVITTCAVTMSIVISNANDSDVRWSLVCLGVFTLVALLMAVLAVLPKFRGIVGTSPGPAADPFFFAEIAGLHPHLYEQQMMTLLSDPTEVHRALVRNVHAQSTYLLKAKYRFLKLAYVALLLGFLSAAVVQLVSVLTN